MTLHFRHDLICQQGVRNCKRFIQIWQNIWIPPPSILYKNSIESQPKKIVVVVVVVIGVVIVVVHEVVVVIPVVDTRNIPLKF